MDLVNNQQIVIYSVCLTHEKGEKRTELSFVGFFADWNIDLIWIWGI